MSTDVSQDNAKRCAMAKIETINAVEGFDPSPLAIQIGNMNEGGVRYRLPVMAQMAWFRLKYPEGRIAVSVKPGKDAAGNIYFIGEARVYAHYNNPTECFLAEGSAARGTIPDKATVSPREWAQTSAVGMALRNAGFGLQFAIAGESFEDNTLIEFAAMNAQESLTSDTPPAMPVTGTSDYAQGFSCEEPPANPQPPVQPPAAPSMLPPPPEPELTPLEKAMATPCPIARLKGKTLGEVLALDPGAIAYIAKNDGKYSTEIAGCARLICENAVTKASA